MSHMGIPNIFEKHEGNNMMWDIYSRQLKDRIIWLGADVNSFTANAIVAQLLYLDTIDKEKDIHLYINSPGGVITSGMAIYDTMNYVAADVSTLCIGQAASMGAFLLGAGAKGKRFTLPNAEVMIHQPSGGASGQASDIAISASHILSMRKRLNGLMAEHTGQSIEKIAIDTERDHFMTADEALEYGIVDEIVNKRDRSLYKDQEE
jgi:ATP-dependent Clp protease protease subunit